MQTKEQTCPECGGSGQDKTQPPHTHGHPLCKRCWGMGRIYTASIEASDWFSDDRPAMALQSDYDALLKERDDLQREVDACHAIMAKVREIWGVNTMTIDAA